MRTVRNLSFLVLLIVAATTSTPGAGGAPCEDVLLPNWGCPAQPDPDVDAFCDYFCTQHGGAGCSSPSWICCGEGASCASTADILCHCTRPGGGG